MCVCVCVCVMETDTSSSVTLTVAYGEEQLVQVGPVGLSAVVEDVMAVLEVETGLPVTEQVLVFAGKRLAARDTVAMCGLKDGDVLMLMRSEERARSSAAPGGPSSGGGGAQDVQAAMRLSDTTGEAEDPNAFIQAARGNAGIMGQLRQVHPGLAEAVTNGDVTTMQTFLKQVHARRREYQERVRREAQLATADPFDVQAQMEIERRIMQSQVEENFQSAMEHNPESFANVIMLYIDVEVNGKPLKAFVDSGAQRTIMSDACARACNLTRLVDERFQGIAQGVGTGKILGRVHSAPLRIAGTFFPCTFTILENQSVDLLLGLDMLKRFQCCIDLEKNELRLRDESASGGILSVRFLGEHELPENAKEKRDELPPSQ